ncbi:hypothetical protein [Pseudoxanthomonas sp. X-1]|uniref:hypothetical protein n=1 Tax=Pseudoxanthomonas sp. X-1 TaxID=2571115 RepID=UPI001485E2ED|nr:hypothetical protein [Pseudoxanthomonas sp. X-1]UAY76011.1 hypothetical protein LAJ50_07175 [Pseudoxanthomonas sp. X-1]
MNHSEYEQVLKIMRDEAFEAAKRLQFPSANVIQFPRAKRLPSPQPTRPNGPGRAA